MKYLLGTTLTVTAFLLLIGPGCNMPRIGTDSSTSTSSSSPGTENWTDKETKLTVLQPIGLADFPEVTVPDKFSLVEKESFTATSDKYRIAHLTYVGKHPVIETVNFYRDQMTINGWKLEYVMGIETKTMDFYKEDEGEKNHCRVTIGPDRGKLTRLVIDFR